MFLKSQTSRLHSMKRIQVYDTEKLDFLIQAGLRPAVIRFLPGINALKGGFQGSFGWISPLPHHGRFNPI